MSIIRICHPYFIYLSKRSEDITVDKEKSLKLFEQKTIRTHWDEEAEKWYFSIMDVCEILAESIDPAAYWRKLKQRLLAEGNQTVTDCHGLKMLAKDGKMRMTDVADTEQLLRLIQSIPSPKAEPFKIWLAKVGSERIDETADPELSIDRALETYLKKGYSKSWINQRLKSIEVRKDLTDEWEARGVQKGLDYAILTDEITKAWAGKTTKEYKIFKGLKKENLRDNMSNLELILNMLAEESTTEISRAEKPDTFDENKKVARAGGSVAKAARVQFEKESGKQAITSHGAKELGKAEDNQTDGNGD